jgi:hypothetical protein
MGAEAIELPSGRLPWRTPSVDVAGAISDFGDMITIMQ